MKFVWAVESTLCRLSGDMIISNAKISAVSACRQDLLRGLEEMSHAALHTSRNCSLFFNCVSPQAQHRPGKLQAAKNNHHQGLGLHTDQSLSFTLNSAAYGNINPRLVTFS